MIVEIDPSSGFCFGVVKAIEKAETTLTEGTQLYCLGEIVHNNVEVGRLERLGLKTIDHRQFEQLRDCTVLIRAHGEPPETYTIAKKNNITLVDASCPVVLKLQERVRQGYEKIKEQNGQLVIYGKRGHAEVNGLIGHVDGNALIIENIEELSSLDFTKPIILFSQTTKSKDGFFRLRDEIKARMIKAGSNPSDLFTCNDTICHQVANRESKLIDFSEKHEVILFVSDKQSSNGKVLYSVCKERNPHSYFISDVDEIQCSWFNGIHSIGISGATSTPYWLMEKVAYYVKNNCK